VGSTSTITTTVTEGATTVTVTLTTTSVAYDINIINVPASITRTTAEISLNPTFKIFNNGPLSQDCTLKFWVVDPNLQTVYSKERTVFTPAYAETDVTESFSFQASSDGNYRIYSEILTQYTPHPSAQQQFTVTTSYPPVFPTPKPTQYALVVHVVDLFGMNAPDLTVKIVRVSDGKLMATLTTDASGLTDMVKLPKGQYSVDVYKDDVLQLQTLITLTEDTTTRIQIGIPVVLTFTRFLIILLIAIILILLYMMKKKKVI